MEAIAGLVVVRRDVKCVVGIAVEQRWWLISCKCSCKCKSLTKRELQALTAIAVLAC